MIFTLPIIEIIQETHNVKTFRFDKPAELKFKPGDHAKVSLPTFSDSRPFTFSSAPNDVHLDLTIKLNDSFTIEIFKKTVGDKVIIEGPIGEGLQFKDNQTEPLLLIAAGSGVTPLMSIIRHIHKEKLTNNMTLLFANKTKDDIIYETELDNLQIEVHHAFSQEKEKQRIDETYIFNNVPNAKNYRWFICGPPTFVKAIITIAKKHIMNDKIMAEVWFK